MFCVCNCTSLCSHAHHVFSICRLVGLCTPSLDGFRCLFVDTLGCVYHGLTTSNMVCRCMFIMLDGLRQTCWISHGWMRRSVCVFLMCLCFVFVTVLRCVPMQTTFAASVNLSGCVHHRLTAFDAYLSIRWVAFITAWGLQIWSVDVCLSCLMALDRRVE